MKTNLPSRFVAACAFILACATAHAQTGTANSASQLQADLNTGDTTINITGDITGVAAPILIGAGTGSSASPITINAANHTISGSSEIFFVQSGTVTINNATLTGALVGGTGGSGGTGGGGGLGAGGAIFVGSMANVTASNVSFINNQANGGNAGATNSANASGGGGGLNGGNGGNGFITGGGGGGNAHNGGDGDSATSGGGGGGLLSFGAPGSFGGVGGAPAGGAGGFSGSSGSNGGTNGGGGGGGFQAAGGSGGSYAGGGGGGGFVNDIGGNGGFGGGGGGGSIQAGLGGFGGGGGAGSGASSSGGVGAGNGGATQGGGGAGLGGAVFVQQGGTFVISGASSSAANSVRGGTGASTGAAAGSDLFLQTGSTTTLAPGTGNTIALSGNIADDSASSLPSGHSYVPGTASGAALVIGSSSARGGTVYLNGFNTYTGGTTVTNGTTLLVGSNDAVGTGHLAVNNGTLALSLATANLNVTSYSQQNSGNTSLLIGGSGGGGSAQQINVTNAGGLPSAVDLGGGLTLNLGFFTVPVGAPKGTVFSYTFLTTTNGYDGTYQSLTLLDSPGGLHGMLDYVGDDVIVDLIVGAPTFSVAGLSKNEQAVLAPINHDLNAGTGGAKFTAFTNALTPFSGSPSTFGPVLDELLPSKFNQFASTTAFNNAVFDTQAFDSYLAGQRSGANGTFTGGSGQLDASGLVLNQPGVDPTLALIHSRLLAWNQPDTISDVASPLLGGIDMKDPKAMRCCVPENTNPWNVFVRGNVILAQDFSQGDIAHVDDNTESVVIGADYRVTPNFLVGLSASYAHTDATLDTFNSNATVNSYSPGIYASYADHGWYANFVGRYSYNSYSENRNVDFLHQNASGSTDGNEGVVDLDGGYDFHSGAWTYGPLAGLQYTHLTLNSFTETGSLADLNVNEDQSDSLRSRLGFSLSYAYCTPAVCLTPRLSVSWQHEFMDQSRGITSQFDDFGGGSFVVRTPGDSGSQDSALIDLGLDAHVNKSVSVFGDYMVQAGQDNYFGQSVQAGVKIGF